MSRSWYSPWTRALPIPKELSRLWRANICPSRAHDDVRMGENHMRAKSLTSEQMETRVARFHKLQTYQTQNFEAHNIPPGAVEKVAARRVYPVMAPADYQGRSAGAPVKGPRGLIVSVAECEPSNGPGLHRHLNTVENFFCLSGRFEIAWGDRGEHRLVLEPLDMISVPRGENRSFRNVSTNRLTPSPMHRAWPKRLRRSTARLRWKACKRSVSSLRMNRARERLDAHGRASVAALEPAVCGAPLAKPSPLFDGLTRHRCGRCARGRFANLRANLPRFRIQVRPMDLPAGSRQAEDGGNRLRGPVDSWREPRVLALRGRMAMVLPVLCDSDVFLCAACRRPQPRP